MLKSVFMLGLMDLEVVLEMYKLILTRMQHWYIKEMASP